MVSYALWQFVTLLQVSIVAFGRATTEDSTQLKKVWLRYNKEDATCFKAINKLSEDTTSSFQVLRQMKKSKSVLAKIGVQEMEGLKKSIPCIREIVADPARYPILGPVHEINRRDLLVWEGQARTYGFDLVQADKLHARGLTGEGISVCIVDSGFDSTHEDFDHTKFSGVSLLNDADWNTDENGHGTLSAGIIAAQDNDLGLIGVAPGASVIVVKMFDFSGSTMSAADLMLAVERCQDEGAHIINMSLGGFEKLAEEEELFADLFNNQGILSVASSGNSGFSGLNYPASYPFVVSVGAVNRVPEIASFSTFNDFVDITAPGVDVWSTVPDNFDCTICSGSRAKNYASYDGTSASAPFVSGVAALLWSLDPTMNVTYVNNALLASALDAGRRGRDPYYGEGILQGDAAFETLMATLNGTEELQDWRNNASRCEPGDYTVSVDMVSDNYPDEVFWQVTRMVDGFPVMAGNGAESELKCLPKNCYMIKVVDAAGDGVCCDFGQGSFTVAVKNQVILNDTNFTDSVEAEFGDSCVPSDFDSKVPCVTFSVDFTTDSFYYENTVLLEDLETGQIWWEDVVLDPGLNAFSQCINPASCTAFTVFDFNGDGIGSIFDPTGNLVLIFDGVEIFNGLPEFTREFSWFVGDSCVNNSTGLE